MKTGRHRLEAVILNRLNYGEADLIVSFFTRQYGKVKGMAKNGRKSRKRFGNVLSPAALVELSFSQAANRDLVRLESGDLIKSFDNLEKDLVLLAKAGQALELVESFGSPLDPAPELFDLLVWVLERLDQKARPDEAAFIFKVRLLGLAGFGPNLSSCGVCGLAPSADRGLSLKIDTDGMVCRHCAPGGFPVSLGAIKIMSLVQTMEPGKIDRIRIPDRTRSEAEPFFMAYLRHILGHDLKTARFLESIVLENPGAIQSK